MTDTLCPLCRRPMTGDRCEPCMAEFERGWKCVVNAIGAAFVFGVALMAVLYL